MVAGLDLTYCLQERLIERPAMPLSIRLEGFVRGLVFAVVLAIIPGITSTTILTVAATSLSRTNEGEVTIPTPISIEEKNVDGFTARVVGNVGGSMMLTRDLTGMSHAGRIYWKSENPAVIEVDENTGVAHFLSVGRTEVCSTDRISTTSCVEAQSR